MTRRRGRVGRIAAAALVLSEALGSPATARAEPDQRSPEPLRLAWTRSPDAEACPEAAVIEADVTARLGGSPFRADATDVVDVHVTRERGEWSALIEDRPNGGAPTGSRVVTSGAESCDSLALAVGLAIALMIRARAPSEPAETPKPVALVTPAPPVTAPSAPLAEPRPNERHVAVFASAVGAAGILPRFALGVGVAGHVPLGERASIVAGLTFLPEQKLEAASGQYAFGATFGELAGCYGTAPARVRLSACATALVGALHVVVSAPLPLEPGARFWGAGALGLAGDFKLAAPFHLLASVDGAIPFTRHSYVVERGDTSEVVFTEPRVAGLFRVGIGVEL